VFSSWFNNKLEDNVRQRKRKFGLVCNQARANEFAISKKLFWEIYKANLAAE